MKTRLFNSHTSGFTIVELIVVIAAIAILATVVLVGYREVSDDAQRSVATNELARLNNELTLYRAKHAGAAPSTLADAGINADNTALDIKYDQYSRGYCVSVGVKGEKDSAQVRASWKSGNPEEGNCDSIDFIAGKPLAFTSNRTEMISFSQTPEFSDHTLYAAFYESSTDTNYSSLAKLSSPSGTAKFQLDSNAAGSSTMRYRLDSSVSTNVTSVQPGVTATPGYHVGWLEVSSNGTVRSFAYDKPEAHTTLSFNPGSTWSFNSMSLSGQVGTQKPLAAVAYNTAHDEATRARIIEFLLKKYSE